ncbi:hypothetical protein GDO86_003286 [Hymenochirus boettgeri]|uniref:Sushi domain-containing protein n=1 Tax=Hymenochirus boettgeri TaxID=247094 RepID=A0A8T2K551_9PIPI|nr:hypothetical protein GDO86_003286 [Hymenochirus boettgeri]
MASSGNIGVACGGDCGPAPVVAHTEHIDGISFPVHESVVYSCDRKAGYYEIPGKSRTISCEEDSTWSTIPEFCARACDVPPRYDFAQLMQEYIDQNIFLNGTIVREILWTSSRDRLGIFTAPDFLCGSEVIYSCDEGYKMISKKNSAVCQADGKWSNTPPICEAAICLAPDPITNGIYSPVKDEYRYQDAVLYKCNQNLVLIGEPSLTCLATGEWNEKPPFCKDVECSKPIVQNSEKESGFQGPYYYNAAVSFKCNEGFMMNGSAHITCSTENEWMPSVPQCLRFCYSPPLKYGKLTEEYAEKTTFFAGSTVKYVCLPGYSRSSNTEATMICLETSRWSSTDTACKPIPCKDPEEIKHGKIVTKGPYVYNVRVEFNCDEGYRIRSETNYRVCQADGTWSNKIPFCQEILCSHPGEIVNGKLETEGPFVYKTRVRYICDEGFSIPSKINYRDCKGDGTWSNDLPTCEAVHPPFPISIVIGIVVAAVILALFIALIIFCCKKKKSGKPQSDNYTAHYATCTNDTA